MDFKDYSKLVKKNEYDKERAELFGEAMTERVKLVKRLAYLEQLMNDNIDLRPYMWTTLDGLCKPLHLIDDDHLRNIMAHLLKRRANISKEIQAEAASRNIEVPDWEHTAIRRLTAAQEGEVVDDMDMPDWDE